MRWLHFHFDHRVHDIASSDQFLCHALQSIMKVNIDPTSPSLLETLQTMGASILLMFGRKWLYL